MDEALKRSARYLGFGGVAAIVAGIIRLVAAYRIHEVRSTTKSAVGALRPET